MFILDRRTGHSLYPYQEVSVPTTPAFQKAWPTQPESSIESLTEHSAELPLPAGYTAAPQFTTVQPSPLVFQPLFDGGMEWPPAAYSPRTHFIYSHARYVPAHIGVTDYPANDANCPFSKTCTFTGTFSVPGQMNHGVYGAVDTFTGKVAWKVPVTPQPDSGVGVAGDLVFFGDCDGSSVPRMQRLARSCGPSIPRPCPMRAVQLPLPPFMSWTDVSTLSTALAATRARVRN